MGARTRRWLVRALAPVLILGGAPGLSTAAAAERGPISIPHRYLAQRLHWRACDFDRTLKSYVPDAPTTHCAKVRVPMDWRHPQAHPDITLAIAYSPASGRSRGLLTANPGGPGETGLEFTGLLATGQPRLFRDFDLLGFDPRGYGASERVQCPTSTTAVRAVPTVDDPRVRSRAAHAAEVASAKLFAQACGSFAFNQFVNTQQTVDDLEFLRRLIGPLRAGGDPKLNYIGYSYGTWLGTWYADTYPTHTGRFVLDSNMNWTASMYANQVTDPFSFERRRDEMFYPWLARQDATYGLGITAAAVSKSYERIRAQLLPTLARGEFAVLPSDADHAILGTLYADWQFPDAAEWITQFRDWAGTDAALRRKVAARVAALRAEAPISTADAVARARAAGSDTVHLDAGGEVVRCNDSRYPRKVSTVLRRSDSDAKHYPFVGYDNTVGMCSYWKFPAVTRHIDLSRTPRMLMLQSEGDPATAYEGALAAHRKTSSHTRLVSVDDEGQHGLYIDGPSPCADAIGDAFLFGGTLPKHDVTCGTTPLPSDTQVFRLKGPLDGRSHALRVRGATPSTGRVPEDLRRARIAAARNAAAGLG